MFIGLVYKMLRTVYISILCILILMCVDKSIQTEFWTGKLFNLATVVQQLIVSTALYPRPVCKYNTYRKRGVVTPTAKQNSRRAICRSSENSIVFNCCRRTITRNCKLVRHFPIRFGLFFASARRLRAHKRITFPINYAVRTIWVPSALINFAHKRWLSTYLRRLSIPPYSGVLYVSVLAAVTA